MRPYQVVSLFWLFVIALVVAIVVSLAAAQPAHGVRQRVVAPARPFIVRAIDRRRMFNVCLRCHRAPHRFFKSRLAPCVSCHGRYPHRFRASGKARP